MENNTVIRDRIADYLNAGTAESPDWKFMGTGFTALDENPNAQAESRAYISDRSASSVIRGYETQFPFTTDLMLGEEAILHLYRIARNQERGSKAEVGYVRAEAFVKTSAERVHPARMFSVAVEVSDISGEGAQIVSVAGNLNQVGDFVMGVFDLAAKTFHAGEKGQDGALAVAVNGRELRLRDGLWDEALDGAAAGGLGLQKAAQTLKKPKKPKEAAGASGPEQPDWADSPGRDGAEA